MNSVRRRTAVIRFEVEYEDGMGEDVIEEQLRGALHAFERAEPSLGPDDVRVVAVTEALLEPEE